MVLGPDGHNRPPATLTTTNCPLSNALPPAIGFDRTVARDPDPTFDFRLSTFDFRLSTFKIRQRIPDIGSAPQPALCSGSTPRRLTPITLPAPQQPLVLTGAPVTQIPCRRGAQQSPQLMAGCGRARCRHHGSLTVWDRSSVRDALGRGIHARLTRSPVLTPAPKADQALRAERPGCLRSRPIRCGCRRRRNHEQVRCERRRCAGGPQWSLPWPDLHEIAG